MKIFKPVGFILFFAVLAIITYGQKNDNIPPQRCGTMENLEANWKRNPQLRLQFNNEQNRFNNALRSGAYRRSANQRSLNTSQAYVTVPVVFHLVLNNQAQVTDAQIMAQLDTLNKDYAGLNGDSVHVPAYFKPFFGHSGLQFCLARQTPNGEPTTGIERTTTTKSSFSADNDVTSVKHAASGGADSWGPAAYLNIWVCSLSDNLLGISTFPGTTSDDLQGVVVEYRSLPGATAFPDYNGGKTLTHETGHYFNLIHIWGDDGGACTGTDFIDDTPNQADSTQGCPQGIKLDACTSSGNGVMYQNYMDYTNDDCMEMFTIDQAARMESALVAYRSSLMSSIGCQAPVAYSLDAQLKAIVQPAQLICNNTFSPVVTIVNRGSAILSSVTITAVIDNTTSATFSWTGSLAKNASADITLNTITVEAGNHILKVYLSSPDNGVDENTANDTLNVSFHYNDPVTAISESFEGTVFPPPGWDIINPDNGITWQKVTGVAKTGNASVMINNFNYSTIGQQDYLRLPAIILSSVDSAFFSFQVAAAVFSTANPDTLEVLASTDCGQTYTSLYKKYGDNLVTHAAADNDAFVPLASEWRKDSIDISNYIGMGKVVLAFRNTTGFQNNIYIDDVNLRTVSVNPNLKSKGFLVTPSPTKGAVIVQFYPQPINVKGIEIYNMSGQKVAEAIPNGQSNYYAMDISRYAAGIYVVRVVMGSEVLTKKILKY